MDNLYKQIFGKDSDLWINVHEDILAYSHVNIQLEIAINFEGEFVAQIDGEDFLIPENSCALIMPFETHSYETVKHNNPYVLLLSGYFTELFLQKVGKGTPLRRVYGFSEGETQILKNMFEIIKNPDHSLLCEDALVRFVFGLIEDHCTFSTEIKYNNVFLDALKYISTHLTGEVTLEKVSKEIGVHPVSLSRIFSREMNMNFTKYVNNLRLEYCTKQMVITDDSLIDIAYANGFVSVRNFNRLFKQRYHQSPTEYRLANKPGFKLPQRH